MKQCQAPSKRPIEGVRTKQLTVVADERGRLMEMLRADDECFTRFGQVYLTTAYPGVVKAWHYHKKQTDHFVCVAGMIKLVLFDDREGSGTRGVINEFVVGEHNTLLVTIPPLVFHGFKGISEHEALVVNIPTDAYDHTNPDEFRLDVQDPEIPYDWARKDG